jgi:hypothetical protein
MKRNSLGRAAIFVLLLSICGVATSQNGQAPGASPAVQNACDAPATPPAASDGNPAPNIQITGLLSEPPSSGTSPACISNQNSSVGLNDELWVQIAQAAPAQAPNAPAGAATSPAAIDASRFTLFLNGTRIAGLDPPTYRVYQLSKGGGEKHALVFRLRRKAENKDLWTDLLGSPVAFYKKVSVSLATRDALDRNQPPDVTGLPGVANFGLQIIGWPGLLAAILVSIGAIAAVVGHAATSTTLRDNLLPQLEPRKQPFSLGRCQMAFWFVLIFVSFLVLYLLLGDYNTISSQALMLMGISGATALASVGVDVLKDSPADAANRGLQALGINTHADIDRIKQEIEQRKPLVEQAQAEFRQKSETAAGALHAANAAVGEHELADNAKTSADAADAVERRLKQLQSEIQDRVNTLRTWQDKTQPFVSQGLIRDIVTDINGPTVHRVQVVLWTLALGGVFIAGVYRDLSMPDFNGTLLTLMGISCAGYVGFKYPEQNN